MKEKLKLVIILGGFAMGGAEHMVYEHVKNIDTSKIDVTIVCTFSKQNTDLEHRVEKLCAVQYLHEDSKIGVRSIINTVRAINRINPDIVHAHMGGSGFAAIWAMLNRKPLVVTVHTKPEKAFSSKNEMLIKMALRFGKTRIVAVSEENAVNVKNKHNNSFYSD